MTVKEAIGIAVMELHRQHFPEETGTDLHSEQVASNSPYDDFEIVEGKEREWIERVKKHMILTRIDKDKTQ